MNAEDKNAGFFLSHQLPSTYLINSKSFWMHAKITMYLELTAVCLLIC